MDSTLVDGESFIKRIHPVKVEDFDDTNLKVIYREFHIKNNKI